MALESARHGFMEAATLWDPSETSLDVFGDASFEDQTDIARRVVIAMQARYNLIVLDHRDRYAQIKVEANENTRAALKLATVEFASRYDELVSRIDAVVSTAEKAGKPDFARRLAGSLSGLKLAAKLGKLSAQYTVDFEFATPETKQAMVEGVLGKECDELLKEIKAIGDASPRPADTQQLSDSDKRRLTFQLRESIRRLRSGAPY